MQTTVSIKTTSNQQHKYEGAASFDHERLLLTEDTFLYGSDGGVGDPVEYVIKNGVQLLSILSSPPSLLEVIFGDEAASRICTGMSIHNPEAGTVSIGTMGSIKDACHIISAADDNTNVNMVVSNDALNYAKLVGTPQSGTLSLEGEYIYLIFGNYSESKVYLTDVGIMDENGDYYEYVDDDTMEEYPVTRTALVWARTNSVATITHIGHGYAQGETVAIASATSSGSPALCLPDGDYTIASVTDDAYTVACQNTGGSSGILNETYIYGKYVAPEGTIIAEAMQRCINALFNEDILTVTYEDEAFVLTSLIAGVQNIQVVEDYESVGGDLRLDYGTLYPALDVSDFYVYADGLPLRAIVSAGGDAISVVNDNITAADLVGKKLYIVDPEAETTVSVLMA